MYFKNIGVPNDVFTVNKYWLTEMKTFLPTNFPIGILASMGPDLAGSLQAKAAMSVQVTVGLTEFTRIYKTTHIYNTTCTCITLHKCTQVFGVGITRFYNLLKRYTCILSFFFIMISKQEAHGSHHSYEQQ